MIFFKNSKIRGKKLTQKEEHQVKLPAKHLCTIITSQREKLLVVDWYKDKQPKAKVCHTIEVSLNEYFSCVTIRNFSV